MNVRVPSGFSDAYTAVVRRNGRAGRAARGSAAGIIARLTSAGVSIITIPLLLAYLGAEGYGLWVTAGTLMAWVGLWHIGVPYSLMNKLAAVPSDDSAARSRFVATAWWLSTALGLASLGLLVLLDLAGIWTALFNAPTPLLLAEARLFVVAMWVGVAVTMPLTIPVALLRADQRVDRAALIDAVVAIVRGIGVIIAIRLNLGAEWMVALAVALPVFVLAVGAFRVLGRLVPWPWLALFDWPTARSLLATGAGFVGIGVAALFITSADVLIVVQLLGPAVVPVYSVAFALFLLFVGMQVAVLDGLWPAYAEAYARLDRRWLERAHRIATLSMLVASVVFAIGLVVLGQDLIGAWAGPDAVPPQSLLVVLGGVAIVQSVELTHNRLLIAAGRVRETTVLGLIGTAFNVPISVALGAAVGVTGVALGTLAAYLLVTLFVVRAARRVIARLPRSEDHAEWPL